MTSTVRLARRSPAVLLVVVLLLPAPAQGQDAPEPSLARFAAWSYEDALALAARVDWRLPLYAMGAAVALAPVSPFDDALQTGAQHLYGDHEPLASALDLVNELGGPGVTWPVAGLFAASLATDDARFQDAAFTSLQALLYAGVASYGLKYTIGRLRPYEEQGAYRFAPFSGHTSFPSGHTVTAFAVVTPWVLYYPHPVTYALLALPAGTAMARLAREKHFATDVLAGGALGVATAYWLTRRHQGRAGRTTLTPAVGPRAAGLAFTVRL